MPNKLTEKIEGAVDERTYFHRSFLDDPVAVQTDWTPAEKGGSNFKTHKLVTVNQDRMEFRASMIAMLLYLFFLLLGVVCVGHYLLGFLHDKSIMDILGLSHDQNIIGLFVGIIFAGMGGAMLYFGTEPIVFDKRKGFFWKGKKSPDEVVDGKPFECVARLDKIHALQLILEDVKYKDDDGHERSFHSCELNIVLEDGKRINVVDHAILSDLYKDVATLSRFLGKPVWDAT